MRSVIVYGPQGIGKGLAAPALKRAYRVKRLLEDWIPGDRVPPAEVLILTCAERGEIPTPPAGVLVVSFKDALDACENKGITVRRPPSSVGAG